MKHGNCLFYVIKKYKENGGGYIIIRKSKYAPTFHFLYIEKLPEDNKVLHFVPDKPKSGWRALIDMFWFKGHEKIGDK